MKQTIKEKLPLISVYITTHNRAELVSRAVNSVLAQDYQNFEIIIVNDASSDGTNELLRKFYGHNPKVRIVHLDESSGACNARNVAIKNACGELITGLDDDDEFLPHRLSSLYAAFDQKYSFICSGYTWNYGYKNRERFVSERDIDLNAILSINEASNQVLTKTERLKAVGGFDTKLVSCQDYDLWVRLILKYGSAKRIAGPTYIVNVGHDKPRISAKNNRFQGYAQFYDKHQTLMTERNMTNQAFLRMIANEESLSSAGLIEQVIAGYPILKLRYYLSSNFRKLADYRRKYLKTGFQNDK
jgi:glycosyltransferase involved in cell wall biosynthesis